jgi:hypothetical protein
MAGFERIVRPYETADYSPPQIEFPSGLSQSSAPVRIRPGLVGATKTFHVSYSIDTTAYVVKKPKEKDFGFDPTEGFGFDPGSGFGDTGGSGGKGGTGGT